MEEEFMLKGKIKVIIDLLELKNINLKNQSLSMQEGIMVQNNYFYSVIDCLIASLMDKYKINYEILRNEMRKN